MEQAEEELPCRQKIIESYRKAVEFKLKVDFDSYKDLNLKDWVEESTEIFTSYYLWYERKRLQTDFTDWEGYAAAVLRKSRNYRHHPNHSHPNNSNNNNNKKNNMS